MKEECTTGLCVVVVDARCADVMQQHRLDAEKKSHNEGRAKVPMMLNAFSYENMKRYQ